MGTLKKLLFITILSLLQLFVCGAKQSYVVYLGAHSHGPDPTLDDYERATDSHHEILGSVVGSKDKAREAIFYSYTHHINGFAAELEAEEAEQLKQHHPKVISVFKDLTYKPLTTHSWASLDLVRHGVVPASSIWRKSNYGEDVIIANLDSGVWPESASFSDEGMGPVPSRWRGFCDNNTKEGVPCNRKLIGARYFHKGMAKMCPTCLKPNSARDVEGHGTHTLSTAGGRAVPGANQFGFANGTASGGAPLARVASYAICWPDGQGDTVCTNSDTLAAFDAAIHDRVDVLSLSFGPSANILFFLFYSFLNDAAMIGGLHAAANEITVVCAAGNDGGSGTVVNAAPWVITVGTSTTDREERTTLTLGNKQQIQGASLHTENLVPNKFYPLFYGRDVGANHLNASTIYLADSCVEGALEPGKVRGKIVVCQMGVNDRVEKSNAVAKAGGVGAVLEYDQDTYGNTLIDDAHKIPTAEISYQDSFTLDSYMNSTRSPVGFISAVRTVYGLKPAPGVATFSSKGPNVAAYEILKPDVVAPGVNILAAYTGANSPANLPGDSRRVPYAILSGTSMATPHVAGVVGLLRKIHPEWSPAAIRSAIMTTARTRDNAGERMRDLYYADKRADPLAYGAGLIRPNRAVDPGLIYDNTMEDYFNFLCSYSLASNLTGYTAKPYMCPDPPVQVENINSPSISAPNLNKTQTVTRTVRNVGPPATYRVRWTPPKCANMTVSPTELKFDRTGEEKTYEVTFRAKKEYVNAWLSGGGLIWSDGKHHVRSPVVVQVIDA